MNSMKQLIILSIISLLLIAGYPSHIPPESGGGDSPVEFSDPLVALPEPPLTGTSRTPDILITASRQSHEALAKFLHTTSRNLRHANPRLPDPVEADELVIIPTKYLSKGETLIDIAEKTGLPLEMLQETNLSISADERIAEGMLLAVPSLYIVPEDILPSSAADALGTDHERLLSANPSLQDDIIIRARTVLVVPPSTVENVTVENVNVEKE